MNDATSLPPGVTLDSQSVDTPASAPAPTSPTPPPGVTLDTQSVDSPTAASFSVHGENLPPQQGVAGPMSPEAEAASRVAAQHSVIDADPNHDLGKSLGSVGAGIGENLLHGVNSGLDLVPSIPHATLQEREAELHDINSDNPGLRGLGYGGATLTEFMLGDEALAGMKMADKLTNVAKMMKYVENSPRVLAALKIGAGVQKSMGALTQEEQALVSNWPVLTRILKNGVEGLRGGAVQGGLAALNEDAEPTDDGGTRPSTIGDRLGTGLEQGIEGSAVNAGLGGIGGTIAGTVEKLKNVPVDSMVGDGVKQVADSAQPVHDFFSNISNDVKSAKQKIDDFFEGQKAPIAQERDLKTGEVTRAVDNSKLKATSDREAALDEAKQTLESRKAQAEKALAKSRQANDDTFAQTLASVAPDAEDPDSLPGKVNDALNRAEAKAHTDYETGMNGPNGVLTRFGDKTLPIADNPVKDAATDALRPLPKDAHAHARVLGDIAGANLRTDIKQMLEDFRDGVVSEGKGTKKVVKPVGDYDANALISMREKARSAAAGFDRGDPNRIALGKVIEGIDNSLESLAGKADDPGVKPAYDALRSAYKRSRAFLDSDTADKLNLGRPTDIITPDATLGDVNKWLLTGENPVGKINTLKQTADDEQLMAQLASTKMKQLSQMKPADAIKEINSYKRGVREAFFSPTQNEALDKAMQVYKQSNDYAEGLADLQNAAAKTEKVGTERNARKVGLLTNKIIDGAKADALKRIGDKYDEAIAPVLEAHATASEPFSGTFMQHLTDGTVDKGLMNGQVSIQDLRKFRNVVGDSKFQDAMDGIRTRAMADNTTVDKNGKALFDPTGYGKWWADIHPDIRTEMFGHDPNMKSNMEEIAKSAEFQQAVTKVLHRAGVTTGTIASILGGGALGILAGSGTANEIVKPLLELSGAVTGGIGGIANHKAMGSLFESMAQRPAFWENVARLSRQASKINTDGQSSYVGRGVKNAAGMVLGSTAGTMGSARNFDKDQSGKPYVFSGASGLAQ